MIIHVAIGVNNYLAKAVKHDFFIQIYEQQLSSFLIFLKTLS